MAYTTIRNAVVLKFRDIREDERTRTIELGGLVVVTDDDANLFNDASKSKVASYFASNKQGDAALVADADSEVRTDTLRLFFRSADQDIIHMDVPDPHDELFLSLTGPGANILKDRSDLALGAIGSPELAVETIIVKCLAGSYLMSDGETGTAYLYGERVV